MLSGSRKSESNFTIARLHEAPKPKINLRMSVPNKELMTDDDDLPEVPKTVEIKVIPKSKNKPMFSKKLSTSRLSLPATKNMHLTQTNSSKTIVFD